MIKEVCDAACLHIESIEAGLVLSVISCLIAWSVGFFRLPLKNLSEKPFISLKELLIGFGAFLGIALFIAPIISMLWLSYQSGSSISTIDLSKLDSVTHGWMNVMNLMLSALCLFTLVANFSIRARQSIWREKAFESVKHQLWDFTFGGLTWFIVYPLIIVVSQLISYIILLRWEYSSHLNQVAVKFLTMTTPYPYLLVITILLIVFVVPMMEELLFRGLLQTWLKRCFGTYSAIMISASVFSVFHYSSSQGIENIELIASLFVLGCFLGFIYERQQSLWASIGLHSIFNGLSVLAILFVENN